MAPATAVGPLVGALGLNPVIAARIVKREAEAEADAEADPQFLINGFASVAAPVHAGVAVAPAVVAPVAVAPRQQECQQKVER